MNELFDADNQEHIAILAKLLKAAKILPSNRMLATTIKEQAVGLPLDDLQVLVQSHCAKAPESQKGPVIRKGIQKHGWIITIYGQPKIGKTTLAAQAPKALIADVEDGVSRINCESVKIDTWRHFEDIVGWFATSEYQTLVVDTVDALEKMLWTHICARNKWKSIEAPGYRRGYVEALEMWIKLLSTMRQIRKNGKNFIFTAHSQVKNVLNPEGDSFDRNTINLDKSVAEYFFAQCDAIFYACYDAFVSKNNAERGIAMIGERILRVGDSLASQCGNRFGLTGTYPLDAEIFNHFNDTI